MEESEERLIAKGNERTLTYGEHISRYLSAAQVVKGKKVLDVASGSGYGTHLLAGSAKDVTGLDYNEDAVKYAAKEYGAQNIKFVCGNAEKMPFKDNEFEVVVSFETLEHLYHQKDFISEVRRVLQPGGLFVVSTPNDEEFIEGNVFHVHELDFKGFKSLLSKNFKYVQYYYQATYYTASLVDEAHLKETYNQPLRVHKTFSQTPANAIYYLAVASDGALEQLEYNVVLADSWSSKREQERETIRSGVRAGLANELKQVKEELAQNKKAREHAETELRAIYASRTWQAAVKLRKTVNTIKLRPEK